MRLQKKWAELAERHGCSCQKLLELESKFSSEVGSGKQVFPLRESLYSAFDFFSPEECRVVILGQDPYIKTCANSLGNTVPQAMGLSFSVPEGAKLPPSLRNIFKELSSDLSVPCPSNGDLRSWARQGVLLLNTHLSVEAGKSGSHSGWGWDSFSGSVLRGLAKSESPVVFILWGNHARSVAQDIQESQCVLKIESSHPSPIGGSCNKGFFGSRPFSRANEFLRANGVPLVQWSLS